MNLLIFLFRLSGRQSMRIKSRFVLITGGFLIAVVFYQIGRARQPDNTKKFYLDGPNPDSGKFRNTIV